MDFKTRFLRNIFGISLLFVLGFTFFYKSLNVFFVQDDYILINNFSQNNLWQDFKNVFAYPNVSHWRPLHNLYFLVSGNLFGKFYPAYFQGFETFDKKYKCLVSWCNYLCRASFAFRLDPLDIGFRNDNRIPIFNLLLLPLFDK